MNLPPFLDKYFGCRKSVIGRPTIRTRYEFWLYIPGGWSRKPAYHQEYLAYSHGWKTVKWLWTLDFTSLHDGDGVPQESKWRLQNQKKHYGTSKSVLISDR